jgi:hypothetical protein
MGLRPARWNSKSKGAERLQNHSEIWPHLSSACLQTDRGHNRASRKIKAGSLMKSFQQSSPSRATPSGDTSGCCQVCWPSPAAMDRQSAVDNLCFSAPFQPNTGRCKAGASVG